MPDSTISKPFRLDLLSDFDGLALLRGFVRRVVGAAKDLESNQRIALTGRLQLAATEAMTNIIRHAYNYEFGRPILCTAMLEPEQICIKLTHDGDPFQPPEIPDAIEPSEHGGMGLFLIANSVDEARYTQDDDGRQVVELVSHIHR